MKSRSEHPGYRKWWCPKCSFTLDNPIPLQQVTHLCSSEMPAKSMAAKPVTARSAPGAATQS